MNFEDFFENDHKKHRHEYEQPHSHTKGFYLPTQHNPDLKRVFLEKIQNNPKLKMLLVIAIIVILGLVIGIILLFMPLLSSLISYVSENGIQGLIDAIWKGSKK